jgi:hypothetical protein
MIAELTRIVSRTHPRRLPLSCLANLVEGIQDLRVYAELKCWIPVVSAHKHCLYTAFPHAINTSDRQKPQHHPSIKDLPRTRPSGVGLHESGHRSHIRPEMCHRSRAHALPRWSTLIPWAYSLADVSIGYAIPQAPGWPNGRAQRLTYRTTGHSAVFLARVFHFL